MATDIIREFDPNFPIPDGLKGAVEGSLDNDFILPVSEDDADIDIQSETMDDDLSSIDDEAMDDDVEAPDSITIISQTVRTAPDGRQVVDVVIDVADVTGAINYDVRITKA